MHALKVYAYESSSGDWIANCARMYVCMCWICFHMHTIVYASVKEKKHTHKMLYYSNHCVFGFDWKCVCCCCGSFFSSSVLTLFLWFSFLGILKHIVLWFGRVLWVHAFRWNTNKFVKVQLSGIVSKRNQFVSSNREKSA